MTANPDNRSARAQLKARFAAHREDKARRDAAAEKAEPTEKMPVRTSGRTMTRPRGRGDRDQGLGD